MNFTIESLKWLNETRNGSNFLTDTGNTTVNFKANAGERVKAITIFTYNSVIRFNSIENFIAFDIKTTTIEVLSGDFFSLGFRVGDEIEIYDNQTNKLKAHVTLDTISSNGFIANITSLGTLKEGIYNDGEIRNLTEFKKFQFTFDTEADISGLRSSFNVFNAIQMYYNDDEVGTGGVRSTAFVDFIPRVPTNWDSGSFRMRYVDNPDDYTQRFEIEHIFIVTPYHLQGYVYDPFTRPDEYKNGTLAYRYLINNIEDSFINFREIGSYDAVGSVGWFNENFNGGTNIYSLDSISYFDVTNSKTISGIDARFTTRVTAVIKGEFVATEPLTVYHSKKPTSTEYTNENSSYNDTWVFESLRNEIGAASNSNTIINNLSINLDSGTQITVQFDCIYSGNEEIRTNDGYILYFGIEKASLTAEASNRVNLLIDSNKYVALNDENDLFFLDTYKTYNHVQNFGVDTPNTDYEGYIEDGILLDFQFRLKNGEKSPKIGNKKDNFDELSIQLVAYNTSDGSMFKITREEHFRPKTNDIKKDGSWIYPIDWFTQWQSYRFLLNSADQFNKSQLTSPTITSDIEYISNDGTYGTYRARIGIKVDWQLYRRLNENISNKRIDSKILDDYHENFLHVDAFDFGDVKDQGLFGNTSEPHGGYNKKIDKYKAGSWIIRPMLQIKKENLLSSDETTFVYLMPEWKLYDYDSNSTYTGDTKTLDLDDNDLAGSLIFGEDNKIIITLDDGSIKTDIANFEGIIRIQRKTDPLYQIHELSTFRETYEGNILKGYGAGGDKVEKSLVADKYTMTCLLEGAKLIEGVDYRITGRLYDIEVPYNPVTDANLVAWYDASGLITNTNNSFGVVSALNEVSVWKNLKTDNNYDLANLTLAQQPIFDNVNFKLDFDGVVDYLLWTDNNLNSEWTIFVVVEMTSDVKANMFNVRRENLGLEPYLKSNIFMFQGEDGSNLPVGQMDGYDDSESLEQVFEPNSTVGSGNKVVLQYSIKYNGDWYIKVNDVRIDTPNDTMGTYDIPATNSLFLGGDGRVDIGTPNLQNAYVGHFHEMLIYPNQDVSAKETSIHDYLKAKWGI